MTEFREFFKVALRGATVVTGEKNQSVVINASLLQGGKEFSHVPVHLHHEVRVRIHLAGTLVRRHGNDRGMGGGERQVQKERLFALCPLLHVGHAFLKQVRQHLINAKIGANRTLAIPSVAVFAARDTSSLSGWAVILPVSTQT